MTIHRVFPDWPVLPGICEGEPAADQCSSEGGGGGPALHRHPQEPPPSSREGPSLSSTGKLTATVDIFFVDF